MGFDRLLFLLFDATSLDYQASRLRVTRQSIIKLWIAERLKEEMKKAGGHLDKFLIAQYTLIQYMIVRDSEFP